MEERYSLLEITLPEDLAYAATEAAKEKGCADRRERHTTEPHPRSYLIDIT